MTVDRSSGMTRRQQSWKSVIKSVLLLVGYLLLTAFLMMFLEPGITPPGFTGHGALATIAVFVGAFHVAGRLRYSWVYLVFGGLGAMLLLPAYFGDGRLWLRFSYGYTTPMHCLVGWAMFVTVVALLARMFAKIRWRLVQEVIAEGPLCAKCGYDLRASEARCPECGQPFDPKDPKTLRTVRRWDWKWLVWRTSVVSVSLFVLTFGTYEWLYWRSEQPIAARVMALGGNVPMACDLPREWLGLPTVVCLSYSHGELVELGGCSVTDRQLELLAGLPFLKEIHLARTPVNGTGLKYLKGLTRLERLYMPNSAADDIGLAEVSALSHLRELELSGTRVTDAGLKRLTSLRQLSVLWLERTAITDAGVEGLKGATSIEFLLLSDTAITDSGLDSLTALTRLRTLHVGGTSVTDTGLMKLTALPALSYLDVKKTHVTARGIEEFRKLRPKVDVEGP
jgi:hypothetical protein